MQARSDVLGSLTATTIEGTLLPTGQLDCEIGEVDGPEIVYVVSLQGDGIPRASGASALLYVGQGQPNRLRALVDGTHSATRALRTLRQAVPRADIVLSYASVEHSWIHECRILADYSRTHGEMPPANARWERWLAGRFLGEVRARLNKGTSAPCASRPFDWGGKMGGEMRPMATWITLTARDRHNDVWIGSLGWIWPLEWRSDKAPNEHWDRLLPPGALVLVGRTDTPRHDVAGLDGWTGMKWDKAVIRETRGCAFLAGDLSPALGEPAEPSPGLVKLAASFFDPEHAPPRGPEAAVDWLAGRMSQ